MNHLDATIATLSLAMECAALRGSPEMVNYYAELFDAAVERKMDTLEPPVTP